MKFGGWAVMYLELKILSDLALFLGFTAVNCRALLWDKDLAYPSESLTCIAMRLSIYDTVPDIFGVLN